jgi:hypothetical protein
MNDDLRARILEALVTAPCAEGRDIPGDAARYASKPHLRHDRHHFHAFCALCSGEADTLADAVMAVLDQYARLVPTCSECGGRPKRGLVQSEDDQTWQCEGCYRDLADGGAR